MSPTLDWSAAPPAVTGQRRTTGAARLFEVPDAGPSPLHVARIASGPAWPQGLARLDRLAALPRPTARLEAPPGDVVLACEGPDGARVPLCTLAGERFVWGVDPVDWIRGVLDERYVVGWTRPLPSRLPLVNYARVPQVVRGWLARLQDPAAAPAPRDLPFPTCPLDTFVETLRSLCGTLAGGGAAPTAVSPWPGGARAAVTLAHDLDTGWILDPARAPLLGRLLEGETERGYRGAWYLVAQQLARERHAAALERLRDAGHELGAHGWNHDARLEYLGRDAQLRRLEKIRRRFDGLDVRGIRTPWYARSPQLLELIGRDFAYDSSVPNASAFFSAVSGSGCCTVLPYETAGGGWELPMTTPPDTSLPPATRREALLAMAEEIISLGGVVVLTLHPQPQQSANDAGLADWFGVLEELDRRHGASLWRAKPADVVGRYRDALGLAA